MTNMESPSASFKIVRRNELKNRSLALVPASWETRGVLYWPKLKSDNMVNNFIKNHVAPGTPPEVEWVNYSTKVVEANIFGYVVGNTRLSVLLKGNDASSTTDIEKMHEGSMQQFLLDENQEVLREEMGAGTAKQYVLGENNQILGTKNPLETAAEEKQDQSSPALASILATVNVLTNEVQKMRAEFGETTKEVGEIYDVFIKDGINPRVMVNRKNDQNIKFQFEPIDKVDTAIMFENLLENNEYEEELMAHFTEDRARSSHLKGNNVAFDLVDKVFTRAFFDDVSWTGIVKKSCRKKECFRQFVRIRKFFFNLCHSVDENYSMAMCDEWFKNVAIRNSGARMQVKGTRASRTKNRKHSGRTIALIKPNDDESYEDDQVEPKMVKKFVPTDDEHDTNYSSSNENLDSFLSPHQIGSEKDDQW